MNLLYEKTRLMGGRMFRDDSDGGDSGGGSDSDGTAGGFYGGGLSGINISSPSNTSSDSGSSYSLGGGLRVNSSNTTSDSGYGTNSNYSLTSSVNGEPGLRPLSGQQGLFSGYNVGSNSSSSGASLADSLALTPRNIGIVETPGLSQRQAGMLGLIARIAASAGIGGPLGMIAGKAAEAYANSLAGTNYSFGVNGESNGSTGGTSTASFAGGSGSGSGGNGGIADVTAGSGNSTGGGTVATDGLSDIFSIFTGGQGGGSFQAPAYEDDPTGYLAKVGAGYDTYVSNANSNYGLLRNQVMQFNDPTFMAQQRNSRMADVQQQSDAAYQTAMRDRMRRGMNPNSGAFDAMANQRAMQTALGKVQAAAQSDKDMRSAYTSGLGMLGNMNNDFGKVNAVYGSLAGDLTKSKNMFGLQASELGLRANGGALDWAKIATDIYRADKGLQGTQYSADKANDIDYGALVAGSVLNNDRTWDTVESWFN